MLYFCIAFEKQKRLGPVAQLNRAPHYGCGGCGFESRRDHKSEHRKMFTLFLRQFSQTNKVINTYLSNLSRRTQLFNRPHYI